MAESENRFELPGSKPHYPPSIPFLIEFIKLSVEPDLKKRTVNCKQEIRLSAKQDIDVVNLDAVDFVIDYIMDKNTQTKLQYEIDSKESQLVIKLGKILREGEGTIISLSYAAKPQKGFYFITPDKNYPQRRVEAWTQGQSTEARHWYACVDHPQVRFPIDISVTVPLGFTVISNGRLRGREKGRDSKETFHWSEPLPHPSYLTSIVVGKYAESQQGDLLFYVPVDRKEDQDRSLGGTLEIKQFLEEYLDVPYPYAKYSQVTVQDFVAAGMENASCTTLNIDTLHDAKAHLDFTSDKLVAHELAHQWFGDLVTCRDWQHIWLNEGFATYCEALYWQKAKGSDEFQYMLLQIADSYLGEAGQYTRPIVTNVYKHPDDLFDAHSYEKGAWIVHMLRCDLGEKYFRRALKRYLETFAYGSVETDDLRKILESETGKSLQEFFDQWVDRKGHPELEVEFSRTRDFLVFKVEQRQSGHIFKFPLDIRLVFRDGTEKLHVLKIDEKRQTFQIQAHQAIEWFAIDPDLKILKTVSIRAPKNLLVNQLARSKTVSDRVSAARALVQHSSAASALKQAILGDGFWGVTVEAVKSLGSVKSEQSFRALRDCLSKVGEPRTRLAIVGTLGSFRREELIPVLTKILQADASYHVQSQAAVSLGKTRKKSVIPLLMEAVDTEGFQNLVAQGAIAGLAEFAESDETARFLLEKSCWGYENKIRESATLALGKFADDNPKAFRQLLKLLKDDWFKVRRNACRALAMTQSSRAISHLLSVAENDIDAGVRRAAEEAAIAIRKAIKVPAARRVARERYVAPEPFLSMDWMDRHRA